MYKFLSNYFAKIFDKNKKIEINVFSILIFALQNTKEFTPPTLKCLRRMGLGR